MLDKFNYSVDVSKVTPEFIKLVSIAIMELVYLDTQAYGLELLAEARKLKIDGIYPTPSDIDEVSLFEEEDSARYKYLEVYTMNYTVKNMAACLADIQKKHQAKKTDRLLCEIIEKVARQFYETVNVTRANYLKTGKPSGIPRMPWFILSINYNYYLLCLYMHSGKLSADLALSINDQNAWIDALGQFSKSTNSYVARLSHLALKINEDTYW